MASIAVFHLSGVKVKTGGEHGYEHTCIIAVRNGIVYVGVDDSSKSSGESNITRDEDHLVQFGMIHIKDSSDVWLYAKVDGTLYASARTAGVSAYNYPSANFYSFGCKENTHLYLKSTGNPFAYKNVIDTNDSPEIYMSNGNKGFYFKLANTNSVPWDGGWGYRSVPNSQYEVLVNGQPVSSVKSCILNHYQPLEYYVALSDTSIVPKANDTIVVSGYFKTVVDNQKRAYVFKVHEMVCVFNGTNFVQQPSLYEILSGKLNEMIDMDLYNEEGIRQINAILTQFENEVASAAISYQCYQAYNKAAAAIEEVEFDEAMAEIKLNEAKESAIQTISNYVDINNYYEEQALIVSSYIEEAISKINNATNKKDIEKILDEYKAKIDAIKTIAQFGEEAILNQEEGFEQYLDIYDVASLTDVNMKETEYFNAYHVGSDGQPDNGNLYNEGAESALNTFAHRESNQNGNVIFQFTYRNSTNAGGKYGATLFIRLRGIQYFGYRFCLGMDNGGVEIDRMEGDGALCKNLGTKNFVFSANTTYEVQLVAIDVKNTNDVWLALIVDDEIQLSFITERIGFCTNARISISDSHTAEGTNNQCILGNLHEGTTCSNNFADVGRAKMNMEENSSPSGIYLVMADGDIPFDSGWQIESYPTSSTAITVNGVGVCDTSKVALKKYGATLYYVCLVDMGVSISDGDELVINGCFTTYTSDGGKVGYIIKESVYVFHSGSGWEYVATLDSVKEDAIFELIGYVDLSNYTEENEDKITEIVNKAIEDINACQTIEEVNELLSSVKAEIDAIQTIIDAYRLHAVEAIDAYKLEDYDLYREEQVQEIIAIKAAAKLQIMNVDTESEIDAIVAQLKLDVDAVPTDAELYEEELASAKDDAKKELRSFYSKIDLDSYSEDIINQINSIITEAMENIDNSISIDSLEDIVNNAKNAINELIAPKNDKKGCGGSIIVTSGIVTLISMFGIGMGLLKRKED